MSFWGPTIVVMHDTMLGLGVDLGVTFQAIANVFTFNKSRLVIRDGVKYCALDAKEVLKVYPYYRDLENVKSRIKQLREMDLLIPLENPPDTGEVLDADTQWLGLNADRLGDYIESNRPPRKK